MAGTPSPEPAATWAAPPTYAGAPPPIAPSEPPTTAMVLSLIGGVFILLGGLAEAWVGANLSAFSFASRLAGIAGAELVAIGALGIVVGLVIVVLAVFLHSHPQMHLVLGVLILVLSFVSLLSFFGGFVAGFLLALIGGVLAISWKPSTVYLAAAPVQRVCPKCGRVIDPTVKFCPHCGAALG
jgi:hypothetical protein